MGKLFAGDRFFSGGWGVDIGENIVDASVIIFNYYFSVFVGLCTQIPDNNTHTHSEILRHRRADTLSYNRRALI